MRREPKQTPTTTKEPAAKEVGAIAHDQGDQGFDAHRRFCPPRTDASDRRLSRLVKDQRFGANGGVRPLKDQGLAHGRVHLPRTDAIGRRLSRLVKDQGFDADG